MNAHLTVLTRVNTHILCITSLFVLAAIFVLCHLFVRPFQYEENEFDRLRPWPHRRHSQQRPAVVKDLDSLKPPQESLQGELGEDLDSLNPVPPTPQC